MTLFNSRSRSYIVGKLPFRLSGMASVTYIFRYANRLINILQGVFAITLFLSWQIGRPILGWYCSVRSKSSATAK